MFMPKSLGGWLALPFLIFSLTIGPLQAQQLNRSITAETEFDLAADALIREIEDPVSGPGFSVLRQGILRLFSTLPPVLQQKLRVEKYGEKLTQVDSKWYPQVAVSGGYKSYDRDSRSLGTTQPVSLTVNQQIWDFGKTFSEKAQVNAELRAERAATRYARSEALLECLRVTLNLQRARRLEFFILGYVNSRKAFAKLMQERKALGAASDIDVVRAKSKVAQALEQIPVAKEDVARAEAEYAAVFGRAPENISYKYYQTPVFSSGEGGVPVAELVKRLPKVQAQMAKVDAALAGVDQLRQRQFGVVEAQFTASAGERDVFGYTRQNTFAITYSLEAFDGFRGSAAVKEATLASSERILELDQLQRDEILLLSNSREALQSARSTVSTRLDLLKSTRAVDAGTRELFSLSRASITDVFREQEAHFLSARQLIESIYQRDLATYRYLHVYNQLLGVFELEI